MHTQEILTADHLWQIAFELAPHLFWAALFIILFILIGPKQIREVLLNARKIGFAGFEVELSDKIAAAAKERNFDLPPHLRERLIRRINRLNSLFYGVRFLWIDDHPPNNENEIEILSRLGAIIDLATSTEIAKSKIETSVYNVILSDMQRGEDSEAGEEIIPYASRSALNPPVIFYVGRNRPAPTGAFGLTTELDQLFHLILDALERRRA